VPLRRLLIVTAVAGVAVVVAIVVAVTRSSPSSGPSAGGAGVIPTGAPLPLSTAIPSGAPQCRFPARLAAPSWYPPDLPLPGGSYASQALPMSSGYHRTVFVVPGSLPELARFVLTEWPNHGWVLGRGDAEANEVEDSFQKSPAIGAFKAQGQFCYPGYALMLIVFAPTGTGITGPVTQPRSPIGPTSPFPQAPSPSPSH
jgi:hypothetical protein